MNFVVVDASVWVSRLVPIDVFHKASVAWFENQRSLGITFLSPSLLLVETAGAISRRTGNARLSHIALERLQKLPALRLINMDYTLIHSAAELAAELKLRGADAIYVAVAARLECPLATLDIEQRTKASKIISVLDIEITS